MPWKATCHMDERMQFIARVLAGEDEMTVLCREYGVSRKTGYKWLGRYISEGGAGLAERSHAPVQHGQAHDVAVVQAVLGLRQRWPHWGPKKLRVKLVEHHPELPMPAASTIGEWLRREGVVGRSRRRRRCPPYTQPFAAVSAANDVWCTDFKGWFRTGEGRRCDPFTLTDAHSRYLLRCQAVARPDEENVRPIFEAAFKERCDGSSSASGQSGSWPANRSRTGATSGCTARSTKRRRRLQPPVWRRSKSGSTRSARSTTMSDRTRRWDSRRRLCCTSRRRGPIPIGSSIRTMARKLRCAACVAPARSNGRANLIFVGEALIGEPVGIRETEGGDWLVRYADVELGYIHPQRRRLSPRPLRG
jgi:putative transposase